jgi:predicted nucleotide-binding protein
MPPPPNQPNSFCEPCAAIVKPTPTRRIKRPIASAIRKSRRTLIEKFEQNAARAAHAVVLLTADDQGRPVGAKQWRLRARQNVIFELGSFIGKRGRSDVTVLYEEGVEVPSDLSAVNWVALDAEGAWKPMLAKDLKYAHIAVELKRAGISP